MKVSFIMLTYGRAFWQPALLNETVWWALNQTHPDVEVLVFNDAPAQRLVCDDPRVTIVNWSHRFVSLGAKANAALEAAAGEICIPNDDDDISLPGRAAQAVAMLDGYDYWTPGLWWYAQGNQPWQLDGNGVGHNCAAFRRDALRGRYPNLTKGHDAAVHEWALANLKCNPIRPTDAAEINYVYRWGVSRMHLSAFADMDSKYHNEHPGPPGEYRIIPQMGHDHAGIHLALVALARR